MEDINSYILGTLYTISPNIALKFNEETFNKYTTTVKTIIFLRQTIVSKLKLHHSVSVIRGGVATQYTLVSHLHFLHSVHSRELVKSPLSYHRVDIMRRSGQ